MRSCSSVRGYVPRSSCTANCAGLTKMLETNTLHSFRAALARSCHVVAPCAGGHARDSNTHQYTIAHHGINCIYYIMPFCLAQDLLRSYQVRAKSWTSPNWGSSMYSIPSGPRAGHPWWERSPLFRRAQASDFSAKRDSRKCCRSPSSRALFSTSRA